METFRDWLKQGFGKKLAALHRWNAWVVLLLTVSGIVLSIGAIRGELGAFRVTLKQLHIAIGALSILLLLLYAPLIRKHWKQIAGRADQRSNLLIVLALLLGWSATGLALWLHRSLPPAWSNTALLLHDLLTWVGVPYAVYHSIVRSRWIKRRQRQEAAAARAAAGAAASALAPAAPADAVGTGAAAEPGARGAAQAVIAALRQSPMTRASFLRLAAGLLLLIGVGPAFYRWLKSAFDTGGSNVQETAASDLNRMLPPPEPLPESAAVIGGGAQGNFRIYTVTEMPVFSSDAWQFAVSGLVDRPAVWDWTSFLQLQREVQVSDFHCITGWSVYNLTWEGIPLKKLLELAGVQAAAKYVKFYSGDKVYTDALSLEQAAMDDVMVAVLMDGKPIPQQLGGPVRLIVPKMYAYKSVKWLQGIELIEEEHIGYWELRGYENNAWVNRG